MGIGDWGLGAKILQNEAGHNPSKKKHLKIDIFKPHIESEKIGGIDGKNQKNI